MSMDSSFSAYYIAQAQAQKNQLAVVVTDTAAEALELEYELKFFSSNTPIYALPGWETLPYDDFSPHQDLISTRMKTLSVLPSLNKGILVVSMSTLMHKFPPTDFIQSHRLLHFQTKQTLDREQVRQGLFNLGYRVVEQVMQAGEFCLRGALIDLFPMGFKQPLRIDLFDDEIDSIRLFDPETQRSTDTIHQVDLLPAREFPLDEQAITLFKKRWREHFSGSPVNCPLYQSAVRGEHAGGLEYYLPLFFEKLATLFDYLPPETCFYRAGDLTAAQTRFWQQANDRYSQLCGDITKPILKLDELFFQPTVTFVDMQSTENNIDVREQLSDQALNEGTYRAKRILYVAETAGRQAMLLEHPQLFGKKIVKHTNWQTFIQSDDSIGITIYPLERGLKLPNIEVIVENQIFGKQVMQRRKRKRSAQNPERFLKSLAELQSGQYIVHLDHGVGQYLGLETIEHNGVTDDYLLLAYKNQDKLYVPIAQLQQISRYQAPEGAEVPLDQLGSPQWQKAKRKALEKIRDVAAELLAIYAKRAARKGVAFELPIQASNQFANEFPFEETPDQQQAIDDIIADMKSPQPMDRLICGDVGFGKTEVALRAAFVAVQNNKQVCVLVPTTLLADQHVQTFKHRFANWPINIDMLSRFRTPKEQIDILEKLSEGKVDILIGTHSLLTKKIPYKDLGLLIVDEEHRFGVRHKEKIKAMRAEVDILTLTATPIPRTLNLGLSGLKQISIIATPPQKRLAVKTFIRRSSNGIVKEAIDRELMRGGQIYYLHNEVKSLENTRKQLEKISPHAKISIAHGQMAERDLERVMADFYHKRSQILLCTTIVESGIDIPAANTIIIDRADKLGLAQLHQLRGRVGRSHHQAYAYLLTPEWRVMTKDARKRIEAIQSMGELGAGFLLASNDLEIRGAGELLGEEQSGHINKIGYGLYMDMLQHMVERIKSGIENPDFDQLLEPSVIVELPISAIIPETTISDVTTRLTLYKRIADTKTEEELDELTVEMMDRFGQLPEPALNLLKLNALKLRAMQLGIVKITGSEDSLTLKFKKNPNINHVKMMTLIQEQSSVFKLTATGSLQHKSNQPPLPHLEMLLNLLV